MPTRTTILGILIAIAFASSASARPQAQFGPDQIRSESDLVEDYLYSLRLEQLVIEHLEIETARTVDLDARRQLAGRLINEYAERMVSGRDSENSEWQSKTQLLLKTYPELSTPAIRIAILQSEYLQSESKFRNWWDAGRAPSRLGDHVDRWRDLATELETVNQLLTAEYEAQVATLQATPEGRQVISLRLRQLEGQLLHTEFLIGWSSYFRGILTPDRRREFMTESDAHFRSFLQIESTKTITEVAPEWFDFSSDWNSRALVGLGMCQRGLDHPSQSQYCFELVGDHATSQQTRDLRYVWELNSRIYLNEVSAAQEFVDAMGEARHMSESGRISFWTATLNSSVATRTHAPVISERLLRAGLTGLVRQFQAIRLHRFLQENEIDLKGDDFLHCWVLGYLSFAEAENVTGTTKFNDAKSKLVAALDYADGSTNEHDLSRCRFLLAKIQFQKRELEAAALAFLNCSQVLYLAAPELAAESQWLAVRSLSELSRTNSRNLIRANRAVDDLIRRFPGSTFAKRGEFEKLRINISNLPAPQAIERLRRIEPNSVNYPLAQNEIVRIHYQKWMAEHQIQSNEEASAFRDLETSQSNYLAVAGASLESKLKVQLLVIDALLRSEPSDLAGIESRIQRAAQVVESADRLDPSIYQEFRYYQFLLANRKHDQQQAEIHAQWLSKNAEGTRFERSALVQLAQMADRNLRSLPNPTKEQIVEATVVYQRLVDVLGSSDTDVKTSPNARVAILRLAELKLASGATGEAIAILESLNSILPNHKSNLRQLAIAYTNAGRNSEAMPIWQKLIRGVDAGSELWFEAKYNLAVCLVADGQKTEAKQLHEQTIRLSPKIPDRWVTPFDALSVELESN